MATYEITKNQSFNSIEIKFEGKPSEAIRDALKSLRFRWHSVKQIWYGYSEAETVSKAIKAAEEKRPEAPAAKGEKVNKFGVKVGDLFRASWGYDQTNVDFFQVIALVGETSVRVREVNPPMVEDSAVGPMAADRTYKTANVGILPPAYSSVFIKDQEKGDLKRVKSYDKDGKSNPLISIDSFANAYYCGSEFTKTYESWYA